MAVPVSDRGRLNGVVPSDLEDLHNVDHDNPQAGQVLGITGIESGRVIWKAIDAPSGGGGGSSLPTVVSANTQYGDPWPTGADILLVDTNNSSAVTLPVAPPTGTQVGVMIVTFADPSNYYEVDPPAGIQIDDLGAGSSKYWATLGQMMTFTFDGTQWWSTASIGRMDSDDGFPEQLVTDNPGAQIGLTYDASVQRVKWAVLALAASLGGLTDVELTSPTDQQVLAYDETNSIWVNTDPSAAPTSSPTTVNTAGDYFLLADDDLVLVDATAGSVVVTFMDQPEGKRYKIARIDNSGNSVTLAGGGTMFFPSRDLPPFHVAEFMSLADESPSRWIPSTPSFLDDLSDVDTSGASGWGFLYNDGASWVADDFQNFARNVAGYRMYDLFNEWGNFNPNDGDVAVWDNTNTEWTNAQKADKINVSSIALTDAGGYGNAGSAVLLIDANGATADVSVVLSTPITSGDRVVIKKVDASANAVVVSTENAEKIDGVDTYTLSTQYQFVTVICDGTDWWVI